MLFIYLIYIFLMSLITFIMYFADKKKAQRGRWRIPEKVLLLMSFLGGAFGGIFAMKKIHHKTSGSHWYFTAINVLGILVHIALIICILFVFKF